MSRSTMLRTRRKDINIKPNRRLDRKSSRGMIYENEELRLRTININAEVEKGQSDIKKLRRENEQLRREIWFIRNEYEKLENKLLSAENSDQKNSDGSENSTTGSSEEEDSDGSCPSCTATEEDTNIKVDNENKLINRYNNLPKEFDHLSVVSEENSGEKSSEEPDTINNNNNINDNSYKITNSILGPDQSYPDNMNTITNEKFPNNFFSPLPKHNIQQPSASTSGTLIYDKTSPDVYVNEGIILKENSNNSQGSFQSGGNLEQLLQDMDLISKDILNISCNAKKGLIPNNNDIGIIQRPPELNPFLTNSTQPEGMEIYNKFFQINTNLTPESSPQYNENEPYFGLNGQKPYKSELNVVLVPNPMPLLGFEKYKLTQQSNPELVSDTSQQFMDKLDMELKSLPTTNTFAFNGTIPPPPSYYNGAHEFNISNDLQSLADNSRICQLCHAQFYGTQQSNNLNCTNCTNTFNFDSAAISYQNSAIPSPQLDNADDKNKKVPNTIELPSPTVQIHAPEEINSPKIIKENFPVTENHLKTIDDTNLDKTTSSSEDKPNKPTTPINNIETPKSPGKVRKHRKFSIHFNGSKKVQEKQNRSISLDTSTSSNSPNNKHLDTPIPFTETALKSSKTNLNQIAESSDKELLSVTTGAAPKSPNLERKFSLTSNTSASIDNKKHVKIDGQKSEKKHKNHDSSTKKRRKNSLTDKCKGRLEKTNSFDLTRSSSTKQHDSWLHNRHYDSFNEFTSLSERERTNSLTSESSRNTTKSRKLSTYSTINTGGKVPWCGCWGNGCL